MFTQSEHQWCSIEAQDITASDSGSPGHSIHLAGEGTGIVGVAERAEGADAVGGGGTGGVGGTESADTVGGRETGGGGGMEVAPQVPKTKEWMLG